MTISIERILEDRDIDAALYLLERLLGMDQNLLGVRKARLEGLQSRAKRQRALSSEDKSFIASSFREVIG